MSESRIPHLISHEAVSHSNGVCPASARASPEKTKYLRLSQVKARTGLGKTKIYELQSRGEFPMRVQLSTRAVGWIEEQVDEWCQKRQELSTPLPLKSKAPKPNV